MDLSIFKKEDASGKMSKESYLIKNHKDEYDFIIEYCESKKIECSFKEKVYLAINNLVELPKCKNIECESHVKFKNSTLGYLNYCSNKCISADPEIKKQKENKSLAKYGTKSPAQSKEIKDKIIKTNNEKWGGNSPMSSDLVKKKSNKTMLENWGVANPAQSEEILKKEQRLSKKATSKKAIRRRA